MNNPSGKANLWGLEEMRIMSAAGRCEYCDMHGFVRGDGAIYLETHHIVALHEGRPDTVANVICLCPNHHREAHFGANAARLREGFLKRLVSVILPA